MGKENRESESADCSQMLEAVRRCWYSGTFSPIPRFAISYMENGISTKCWVLWSSASKCPTRQTANATNLLEWLLLAAWRVCLCFVLYHASGLRTTPTSNTHTRTRLAFQSERKFVRLPWRGSVCKPISFLVYIVAFHWQWVTAFISITVCRCRRHHRRMYGDGVLVSDNFHVFTRLRWCWQCNALMLKCMASILSSKNVYFSDRYGRPHIATRECLWVCVCAVCSDRYT